MEESPYAAMGNNPIFKNDPIGDSGIVQGMVDGFTGFFKGVANTVTHPVDALKSAVSPTNLVDDGLNVITTGMYGATKQAVDATKTVIDEGVYGAGKVLGNTIAQVGAMAVGEGVGKVVDAATGAQGLGLGDLTKAEVKDIQKTVDQAGRPLEVGGSAASGTRRGVGTDLPVGKGAGTKSDIDYFTPPSHMPYFMDIQHQLPSIDPGTGIAPGTINPYMGPGIRFEPGSSPTVIPKQS